MRSRQNAAEYLAAISAELADIAREAHMPLVCHLLEMTRMAVDSEMAEGPPPFARTRAEDAGQPYSAE